MPLKCKFTPEEDLCIYEQRRTAAAAATIITHRRVADSTKKKHFVFRVEAAEETTCLGSQDEGERKKLKILERRRTEQNP